MSAAIDLIVPTVNGREASLDRCLASYQRTCSVSLNPIVVPESRTCGWGWKQGLVAGDASYVLLACDDQESISDRWAEVCIETADQDMIPCPRVYNADRSVQSNGGDMKMLHHLQRQPRKDHAPVDYTTIPFMSRAVAEEIGMLSVHYASDVWVSYRGRQLGYPTTLRHGFEVIHHNESVGRGAGYSQVDRDQMDCRTVFDALENAPMRVSQR